MERLIGEMQNPETGVPVRSHKTFLTSLPCVFMGYDLIEWLKEKRSLDDSGEALHLANLLCQYGYFFPVPDSKNLNVKDDSSYYRFQTPYFWPTRNHNPDSTEYAIHLVKRSMRNKQKDDLEEYEQDTLQKLRKYLSHKWEFITMQAEEQIRLSKDRIKMDKIVVDSQERAFWRVHWAPPGSVSSLESSLIPPQQCATRKRQKNQEDFQLEIKHLKQLMSRTRLKVSIAIESLIQHCEIYAEYDFFVLGVQPSNPWITEDTTFWIQNESIVDNPTEKRVKKWAISLNDILSDRMGIQEFESYLRKEYSHENIRFWQAVECLHATPRSNVDRMIKEIYNEYLSSGAPCEVNLDSETMEATQQAIMNPTRFTFDAAQMHVYLLMNKDSYPRFVRSEEYKHLLADAVQTSQKKRFFNFGVVKKKTSLSKSNSNSGANRKINDGNANLTGSTSDLPNSAEDEWSSSSPNVIGHSLSVSNLDDLDSSERRCRLVSSKGKGSGNFSCGTLNVSKPKALSTESCNTITSHNADLTLQVPCHMTQNHQASLSAETKQLPSCIWNPILTSRSIEQVAVTVSSNMNSHNEICPWEGMELPKK